MDSIDVPQVLDMPDLDELGEKSKLLEGMIETAQNNWLPHEFIPELRSLVNDFQDIWSISLQAGAHADLSPLEVKLKPDAVPVRVRVRRYSQ